MPVTAYAHLALDANGCPWIPKANTKIVELVGLVGAHGWGAAELADQLPHLTLGQIHSALAYYWDHRDEVDADLRRREDEVEALRREVEADQQARAAGLVRRFEQLRRRVGPYAEAAGYFTDEDVFRDIS